MKVLRVFSRLLFAVSLIGFLGIHKVDGKDGQPPEAPSSANHMKALSIDGHVFRKNAGQWDHDVYYRSVNSNSSITFFDNKVSFGLQKMEATPMEAVENGELPTTPVKYLVWEMEFDGANNVAPIGTQPTYKNINYFGPNSTVGTKITEYKQLHYSNLYDGVDLMMYTAGSGQLKYDVIVHPHGDVSSFSLNYKGIEDLMVNANGDVIIKTSWGNFTEARPYSYQWIDGRKVEVDVAYKVTGTKLGYDIKGDYNPDYELVIDPIYLDWSTFFYGDKDSLGTWGWTWILDVDIDDNEDVYVTGMTTDKFPYNSGTYDSTFTGYTAFVAKVNDNGDSLLWFTYISSSGWDYSTAITVNRLSQPVIGGITSKNDFPTTSNAFDTSGKTCPGAYCYQSFVTKFDSSGSSLIFSTFLTGKTYLGGTYYNIDWIRGMTLNGAGEVYVCGNTTATDFPTTNGSFQTKFSGTGTYNYSDWSVQGDAFLTKLKSDGSGLVFSTYLGGAGSEAAFDLYLNPNQEIYVVGTTNSNNFPTTPASPVFNTSAQGDGDGFITKFKANGSGVIYSLMLGGSGYERFEGVYANGYDQPYIAGYSGSSNFPVTSSAYQKSNKGGNDIVVFKMPSSGTNLIYSTYLGGTLDENSWSSPFFSNVKITANVREEAIITCVTRSKDFPVTSDALQSNNKSQYGWSTNTAIAKLSYDGDKLLYGTYFGGSYYEYPGAVKTKRVGCVSFILTGGVTGSTDYPTTSGAWKENPKQYSSGFAYSGYLTKFRDTLHTDLIELALLDTIIECDKVFEILDAKNQGAEFWWSHGPKDRMVIIEDTGTYWVAATYGCDTVRDTINVQLEYRPIVPILGNDTTVCDSFPMVILDAKNDTIKASYLWWDSTTNQTLPVSEPGKYGVTISTPNCGSKSDQIELIRRNTPNLQLSDAIFCDSVSIVVDAGNENNDVIYRWYDGDSMQTHTFNDTGTYYVVANNICGEDSASFVFDMQTTPVANLPDDSVFCDNVDWLLHQGKPDNGESYSWTTPDQQKGYGLDDSLRVNAPGGYRIEIANSCGTATDTVFVDLIESPVPALTDSLFYCDEVDATLTVGKEDNEEVYLWSTSETVPEIQVYDAGMYTVNISNKCGSIVDSTLILLSETPLVGLPEDSVFCNSVNILLDATFDDDNATYLWSNGATTPTILVTNTGTYTVTVSNRCGDATDQMTVDQIVSPTIDLGADQVFCGSVIDQSYAIGQPNNDESYLWSTLSTLNTETLGEGKHWARISNKCATVSDTVVLRSSPYPVVDLGPDTILCGNFSVLLDAGNPGMSYLWSPTDETTQTILARKQTVYIVEVTSEDGCTTTDWFEIGSSCISRFHIPTAFTPNNDGTNDVFKPTLVNYEDYSMIIFNRWGEIIFQTDDVNEGWDGTFQGDIVMDGVYFYSIRFITTEDGNFQTLNGPLRVLR